MSHNSPRSINTKMQARQRPDVVWFDREGRHELRFDTSTPVQVLSGGTTLLSYIAEADHHLMAMRKIVQ